MRYRWLAAVLLLPGLAWAENRPYVVRNGRAVTGGGGRAAGGGGAQSGAGVPASAPAGPAYSAPGGVGGGYHGIGARAGGGASRGRSVYRPGSRGNRGFRAAEGGSEEAPPPYHNQPGALIRTAGQQPQYGEAKGARTHTVEAGGFVDIDPRHARDVAYAPGVRQGPRDTPPGANAGGGGVSFGGGVTTNSPTIVENNTTINGNQGGGQGNGFGGGTGFDPSF